MEVVVTGIGLISALENLSQTWQSLLENKSEIQRNFQGNNISIL
jgi:hypothetical protein